MNQNGFIFRINIMLIQPSVDLYDRIINRISREEKIMLFKKKLKLEFFGLILSFLVFILLALRLYFDIAKSGLIQFFSLLFTDFSIVMANIGDYAFTLLESTPAFSLALALSALLTVIVYIAKLEDAYADFKKLIINL